MANLEDWFFRYNAWSFSKHRLWILCKRAYYYRYIGTALKQSSIFDIYKLKQLKNLNSKFVLQGSLIHEAIENQIGQHHLGRELNEAGTKSQFSQRLERYRKTASALITEFYNGVPIDDAFFYTLHEDGLDKISMFFGVIWPQFNELEYLKHEDFDKFKINDVEVIVKVDYVSKTKTDVIVITDWKTGEDNDAYESDLQIGTYALWAMQYYQKEPSKIRTELAYLKTGAMRPYEFSVEDLETIKNKIVADFHDMNHSYEIENYPTDATPKKCISCQFGTICPDSKIKEFLDDLQNTTNAREGENLKENNLQP
jgi:CRISPR/Cas system-associated exonuclease Cas4 (RecB family)